MPSVIITGSGSGLGRELALAWSSKGWRVIATDMDGERAEQTRAMLANADNSISATLDVTQDADFERLVDRLQRDNESIDVLVNNAGIASAGRLSATPLEHWHRLLDVNLIGVVRGCRAFENMLADGGGHIVNIASFAGIANAPAMGAYNVAKAGVISLSETLRTELDGRGVGVTVVCPSFFKTPLLDRAEGFGVDLKSLGTKLMDASPIDAADVATHILTSVERGEFMCIPHRDARWLYRLKRWAPNSFARLMVSRARGLLRQAA
jgi:NAD(P)-dependent dehydrogenase (short-subunit alcohol dehydrogenase family)